MRGGSNSMGGRGLQCHKGPAACLPGQHLLLSLCVARGLSVWWGGL